MGKIWAADTVCKFGGTAMSAENMRLCAQIMRAEPRRRFAVVSAAGKNFFGDDKATDILFELHRTKNSALFDRLCDKFAQIVRQNGVCCDPAELLSEAFCCWRDMDETELVSRGEFVTAKIFAALLGWQFIDTRGLIRFSGGKMQEARSVSALKKALSGVQNAVLPGFYGSDPEGKIALFGRGGSDITGSLVAAAAGAALYENFTDVRGFLDADPRLVTCPDTIDCLSYNQLRLLNQIGANVLHRDCVLPLIPRNLPLEVKSFYQPDAAGTLISGRHNAELFALSAVECYFYVAAAGKKGIFGGTAADGKLREECALWHASRERVCFTTQTPFSVEALTRRTGGAAWRREAVLMRVAARRGAAAKAVNALTARGAAVFFCGEEDDCATIVTERRRDAAEIVYRAVKGAI